jgi:hypothetical protein
LTESQTKFSKRSKKMKNKRILTITIAVVALAIIATFGIFQSTKSVQAQDQLPPPVGDRISFGMVGITAGQTMRVNVSNIIAASDSGFPPGPTRVAFIVVNSRGQALRNRSGVVIRKTVELERGDSTFLDIDFGEIPPPIGDRLQLRAVITVVPPGSPDSNQIPLVGDRIVSTVEVINNANGRTQFAISALPAIQQFQPPPTGD